MVRLLSLFIVLLVPNLFAMGIERPARRVTRARVVAAPVVTRPAPTRSALPAAIAVDSAAAPRNR
jgi:hypothetical protein